MYQSSHLYWNCTNSVTTAYQLSKTVKQQKITICHQSSVTNRHVYTESSEYTKSASASAEYTKPHFWGKLLCGLDVTTCQFVRLINSQVGLRLWLRLLRFVCNSHAEVWFIDNDRRGEVSLCDAEEGHDSRRRIFTTTRSDEEAGRIAAVVPATPLGIGGRRFVRTWFNWTSVKYEAVTYYITSGAAMAQRRWYVFTGVLYVCVVCECLFVCHYRDILWQQTFRAPCNALVWLVIGWPCRCIVAQRLDVSLPWDNQ